MAMVIGPTCRCALLVQGTNNGEVCLSNRTMTLQKKKWVYESQSDNEIKIYCIFRALYFQL